MNGKTEWKIQNKTKQTNQSINHHLINRLKIVMTIF